MAQNIPIGFGLVRLEYDVPGQSGQVFNITAFRADPGVGTADEIMGFIGAQWANVMDQLSEDVTFLGCAGIYQRGGGLPEEGSAVIGEPGGQASAPVLPNTAVLVRKLTGIAGRQNRGRMFIPGIPDAVVTIEGTVDSTWRTNFNTDLAGVVTALNTSDVDLAVGHDLDGPYGFDDPTIVTSLVAEPKVATQRTRLRD